MLRLLLRRRRQEVVKLSRKLLEGGTVADPCEPLPGVAPEAPFLDAVLDGHPDMDVPPEDLRLGWSNPDDLNRLFV